MRRREGDTPDTHQLVQFVTKSSRLVAAAAARCALQAPLAFQGSLAAVPCPPGLLPSSEIATCRPPSAPSFAMAETFVPTRILQRFCFAAWPPVAATAFSPYSILP